MFVLQAFLNPLHQHLLSVLVGDVLDHHRSTRVLAVIHSVQLNLKLGGPGVPVDVAMAVATAI